MHCGFAMISVGCVRQRFAKHIAILVLMDACASALGWYFTGYAFAFGDNLNADGATAGNAFIGTNYFAMANLATGANNVNSYYLWLFEWAFAATACTIVSGAIAERTKFEAYILFSFFMAAWVYPIVVHAAWSGAGWESKFRTSPVWDGYFLFGSGVIDFAGSGVVHMVGGYAAAAGCFVLGPRIGRFLPDGTVADFSGHNTSLFVLGVMILWFGWYGFNPGSELYIVNGTTAVANAAVTTTIAPATAGLFALLAKTVSHRFIERKSTRFVYDVGVMGNGALCGLAAITAGCSTVNPWAAIVIGIVSGFGYVISSKIMVLLHMDDPLDAISVHAFGGTWGVAAVGFFAEANLMAVAYPANSPMDQGVFMGGTGRLLAAQLVHIIWIAGWVLCNMLPFFYLLKVLGLFRVNPEDETLGLDESYHGGSAYPGLSEDSSFHPEKGGASGPLHTHKTDNGFQHPPHKNEIDDLRAELMALKQAFHANVNATK
ncbi:hypothetical protein WJX84_006465 [Apatococcus fuscideae]|uniref:Ammonium transporter n=1 Tax=Apatococcus fuscideae TaxID=2026836 RepID=A0AAW1SZG0_9CHLO